MVATILLGEPDENLITGLCVKLMYGAESLYNEIGGLFFHACGAEL